MNYGNPQLRELLAAEYALGTLVGAARRRFERLLIDDARLRAELAAWETRFADWAAGLPRQAPPARVWRRIERRIDSHARRPSLWTRAGVWQVCTSVAVLALAAVIAWWQLTPAPATPVEMAVIASQVGKPVWVVSARHAQRTLTIKAIGPAAPPAGKAYQLWMLPKPGAAPVSLGLLPQSGETIRRLTATQMQALAAAQALAVSIEPPGGSPTGQPTGPVVYVAPLVQT